MFSSAIQRRSLLRAATAGITVAFVLAVALFGTMSKAEAKTVSRGCHYVFHQQWSCRINLEDQVTGNAVFRQTWADRISVHVKLAGKIHSFKLVSLRVYVTLQYQAGKHGWRTYRKFVRSDTKDLGTNKVNFQVNSSWHLPRPGEWRVKFMEVIYGSAEHHTAGLASQQQNTVGLVI